MLPRRPCLLRNVFIDCTRVAKKLWAVGSNFAFRGLGVRFANNILHIPPLLKTVCLAETLRNSSKTLNFLLNFVLKGQEPPASQPCATNLISAAVAIWRYIDTWDISTRCKGLSK